jgi:hypothetical protein
MNENLLCTSQICFVYRLYSGITKSNFNFTFLYEIEAIAEDYGLELENVGKRNTSTHFFTTRNINSREHIQAHQDTKCVVEGPEKATRGG